MSNTAAATQTAPVIQEANVPATVNFQAQEAAAYEAAKAALLGGSTPAAAMPGATVQTATQPAAATAQQPTQATPQPGQQQATADDPWAPPKELLAPREPSIDERIKARIEARKAKQAGQQAPQPQQSGPVALPQGTPPITQAQFNAYQAHMAKNEVSEALKAIGMPSLEELNRAELKRAGILKDAPPDPRVDSALKELEQLKTADQRKAAEAERARREQAAKAEYQADLEAVGKEIVRSGLPQAEVFVELPEVREMVLSTMVQHEVGVLEAAKLVREQIRPLYEGLHKLFNAAAPAQARPTPGAVNPAPVPVGASPGALIPENLSYDQAWELTRQLAIEGKL